MLMKYLIKLWLQRIAFGGRIKVSCKTLNLPHANITSLILNSCFEVMNELGAGFLESVYKNALIISLQEKGMLIGVEQSFEVYFREQKVGLYRADLVVQGTVIIELKCCKCLLPEHQAQAINYLKAANIPVGLLVNFGNREIEYKRLHHPLIHPAAEGDPKYHVFSNVVPEF